HFKSLRKSLITLGAGMVIPILFFFLLFLRVADWRTSLEYVTFGWRPVFESAVRNNSFYVQYRGMDNPWPYLRGMGEQFFFAILGIAVYALVFRVLRAWKCELGKCIVWSFLILPLCYWAFVFQWLNCGLALPLWCVGILIVLGRQIYRKTDIEKLTFPFLWCVFALLVMAKLGVLGRIWNSGFALAMPAFVITVYFLLWFLPQGLARRYQVPPGYHRATVAVVLLIGFILLLDSSRMFYRGKADVLGDGGNRIVVATGQETEDLKATLNWVNKNVPTNGTIAVLPYGVSLNFLCHRVNPTPCLIWDPNVMTVFGQARMTECFKATPPDYVLIVELDESGLGHRYLGQPGFGRELMQWIKENYETMQVIGHEPMKNAGFGVKILKRLAPSTNTANN
ncbi:MAG TPA: hypothetical protein VF988_17285, partial [Verrucomicrobiae bacterium]